MAQSQDLVLLRRPAAILALKFIPLSTEAGGWQDSHRGLKAACQMTTAKALPRQIGGSGPILEEHG